MRDSVIVPVSRHGTVQFLAAFVVPMGECPDDQSAALAADALCTRLAERVPAYMLPRRIYFRPFLPMTANGKADRRLLSEIAANGGIEPLP